MKYFGIKMKRLLALMVAIATVLSAASALAEGFTAMPALAESYEAVVMGGPLTVYADASLSGKSATLSAYTVVTVSATSNNVARLQVGKYTAYADASKLKPLSEVAVPAVTNRITRVFEEVDLNSRSVTVPKGFRLNVLYYNSTYAVVENDGTVGYALTAHLTRDTAEGNTSNEIVTETYTATVSVSSLPIYKSASTSSKRIATLPVGYAVTVYARNGQWAYVGKGDNYGFCALAGLERSTGMDSDSNIPSAVPVTVTASTMKVYQNASASSKTLGTLRKGAQVNLIRTEGNWAYIELNGNYGYCAVSSLTNESSAESPNKGESIDGRKPLGTATVIQSAAQVYSTMNTSAKSTTLRMGETVSYYGYDSKWVLVGRDGAMGFMLRTSLSSESYAELHLEDSGAGVVQLETALLSLGYLDSNPSSNYTANTATAMQRMQTAAGLNASGSADLATLRVLYSGNAPASPILSVSLSSGNKSENVTRLQSRLFALGYLSRESSIDGDYGSTTASAVRLFQTAAGITATGTADNKTIRALYTSSAPSLASGQTAADQSSSGSSSGGSTGNTTSIPSGLASTTSSYSSSMSNAQKLEYVIYVCQQQLGKKYVFGSAGPNTFDCSGLMLFAFKKIGINLQHSAQGEGYNDKWPKISAKSSLRRGDMIFFNTVSDGDLCDHVGIFLGNNYFLHAGSGAGKVIISSVASGYYSRVFSWGRRVLST